MTVKKKAKAGDVAQKLRMRVAPAENWGLVQFIKRKL